MSLASAEAAISPLTGAPVIEDAPTTETTMRAHGADTALFSGRGPILNKAGNRLHDFRGLQVDTRAAGAWTLAASQATRLGPTVSRFLLPSPSPLMGDVAVTLPTAARSSTGSCALLLCEALG